MPHYYIMGLTFTKRVQIIEKDKHQYDCIFSHSIVKTYVLVYYQDFILWFLFIF